jgi:hypothetical protein
MSRYLPALVPFLLLAPAARAHPLTLTGGGTYFSIGPLLSVTRSNNETHGGMGLEATYNVFSKQQVLSAVGAFAQAQFVGPGYARVAAGVQGNVTFLGVELGLMHQTGTRKHGPATGLHLAPYLVLPYGSVALRVGLPVAGPSNRHAHDVGFVFTAKIPFYLDGEKGPRVAL